jgi:hypothetical protein
MLNQFGGDVRERVEQLFIHRISFRGLVRSYLVVALFVIRHLVEAERFDHLSGRHLAHDATSFSRTQTYG